MIYLLQFLKTTARQPIASKQPIHTLVRDPRAKPALEGTWLLSPEDVFPVMQSGTACTGGMNFNVLLIDLLTSKRKN